ncbi:MAG: hypothetical protein H6617_11840 [Bdellovibrionaceae bacterium]|nr:hypothetical protein [Bdellovibrionales bacterium]MCB9255364.1 hypothetical protein [Pseudobdellovibrionaceae bacterium]
MRALSRTAVLLLVSLYAAVGTAATALRMSQTISVSALAGEAFAEDLSHYTGVAGANVSYQTISGPAWLSLTTKGILYGTPSLENVGLNKLYASVEYGGKTDLFLVEVDVRHPNELPTLSLRAKVGDVFLNDLSKTTGIVGRFSFENLPAWLEATQSGVLVGTPAASDIGTHQFQAFVEGTDESFTVRIEVYNQVPAVAPVTIKVGQFFSVDLVKSIGLQGRYTVYAPVFLKVSTLGVLSGTPSRLDVGSYRIWVDVRQGIKLYRYYFDLVVEN